MDNILTLSSGSFLQSKIKTFQQNAAVLDIIKIQFQSVGVNKPSDIRRSRKNADSVFSRNSE
jgi:hypothetical protein